MNQPSPDLERIVEEAAGRERPSAAPQEPAVDLGVSLEEYQLRYFADELRRLNDNHNLRLAYTAKIYWLVAGWLACVVFCIAASGFSAWGFRLADGVMIAFITSTTVNVVGLFVLVAKWMYPHGTNSDSSDGLRKISGDLRRPSSPGATSVDQDNG